MMKRSLSTVIIATLVGLQCLTAVVILVSSYLSSERAVLGQSHKLMVEEAESAIRHTQRFLEPAEVTLAVSRQLQQQGVFNTSAVPALERYFFEHLKASPELSGLYYGDKDGNFVFVSRSKAVQQADFRTKVTSRGNGEGGAALVYRNAKFEKIAARFDESDTYDPRQRPWYKDAIAKGKATWTDPYIFYSSQQPGITVAAPVTAEDGSVEGVIGIDIEIAALSGFLADLDIGETGAAIVLGANGDVIAHPDASKLKMPMPDGQSGLRFTTIDEIDDPVARAAAKTLESSPTGVDFSKDHFTRFEIDNRAYDAVFAPVDFGNLGWTVAIYVPEDEILGEILSNRNRNIALAIAVTAISILLGWMISRTLTRPLEKLSTFADQLARGEKVDVQALPNTFAEVEQVSTAFRRMTRWLDGYRTENDDMNERLVAWSRELEVRVEERTMALQTANASLRVEIGERAEAERKLATEAEQHRETSRELDWALVQANEASQAKSRFLSGMSHELRTPLNAIIGFGQMLTGHAGALTETQKSEYAGHIQESGERLVSLINQVLDLAGIEAGKMLLTLEAVRPKFIVQRVFAEASIFACERDIELIDETNDLVMPEIFADEMRTTQALVNLVSNAIKYNRDGGEVRVFAVEEPSVLRIAVSDTGPGIPANRHHEVFETFNRLGAESSGIVGSGIGLSLTKEFIEKMGGEVGFESTEGEGSIFWFELPLAQTLEAQAHMDEQKTNVVRAL